MQYSTQGQLGLFDEAMPVPIPAKCTKCGFNWIGRDAIVAPSLNGCQCFWCHATLRPHRGERDLAVADKHLETRQGRTWLQFSRMLCWEVKTDARL